MLERSCRTAWRVNDCTDCLRILSVEWCVCVQGRVEGSWYDQVLVSGPPCQNGRCVWRMGVLWRAKEYWTRVEDTEWSEEKACVSKAREDDKVTPLGESNKCWGLACKWATCLVVNFGNGFHGRKWEGWGRSLHLVSTVSLAINLRNMRSLHHCWQS